MVAAAKSTAGENTDKKQQVPWDVDGPNPEVCLTSCLLDWISTHGNYHWYRGGEGQKGEKKNIIAQEVSDYIAVQGITMNC